jgi:two-component system, OmpR family, alkaline phosphatase synthesis response regulator PhoP
MDRKKVLVVDDEPHILEMVKNRLSAGGFDVLVSANAEEGLALAKKYRPDVIVLDVIMPGIDGKEACRRLKQDKETAPIPVLFLTCSDSLEEKMDEYDAGGEGHIAKPFLPEDLLFKIKRAIERAKE